MSQDDDSFAAAREAPLVDRPEPAMRYGVCVVDPLGGNGVIECWCDSHDAAVAEVAKRGGAATIVGASRLHTVLER